MAGFAEAAGTNARVHVNAPAPAVLEKWAACDPGARPERRRKGYDLYRDWVLEENMVLPVHLFYPSGERERAWLEEVVVVGPDGGRPLFGWGFEPLTGD